MIYDTKELVEELRKSNKSDLYIFHKNIRIPISKVTKITKKYVYFINESGEEVNFRHPHRTAGFFIVDSLAEAWKYYKRMFEMRKAQIEREYQLGLAELNEAEKFLNKCKEETPQYYI